jgi:hypothetical protein
LWRSIFPGVGQMGVWQRVSCTRWRGWCICTRYALTRDSSEAETRMVHLPAQ